MVGRTLEGRYTILARLGEGSMGAVYRAKQHAMGREVAIKILRGDRAADESAKARFLREARANSLLASPNTVTVFDFGESETGEFYLAMELLEGESLGERLARLGRLPVPLAVDAARQALRSLSEAHAKGIIHRDLKPDNLFFARVLTASSSSPGEAHEEIMKVLDFGIAKMLRDEDHPMGVIETQAGTVFGTPRYMSPEQAQGKPLDPRTDLYSLGVILYQMLTGRAPFTDDDAVVVMARHIKSVPKRPNEVNPAANVPQAIEDVIMRALSKNPADRQASADVFAGELLAALEAQSPTTSGVRASVTNAAGIRVPESMRPPPVVLPQPARQRRLASLPASVVVAIAAALVVAAVAAVVVAKRRSAPPLVDPSGAVASEPSEPPSARAHEPLAAPSDLEPVTPDALPTADAPARPAAQPRSRQPRPRHAEPPASATAAPTSTYGVFE